MKDKETINKEQFEAVMEDRPLPEDTSKEEVESIAAIKEDDRKQRERVIKAKHEPVIGVE